MGRLGWIAVAAGVVAAAYIVLLRSWPVINIVETGRTPEYPDIQPKQYPTPPDQVFSAAREAVAAIPRWKVVSAMPDQREIRAEATTRMMRFVDDVTVRIEADGPGTRVDVRSASRIGRSDFGQNARNIRAFFDELDRQMAGAQGR